MCDCNNKYFFQLGCSPQIKLANPNSYYTKSEIDDMLDEIEISGGCGCDLSEYATLEDLENAEDALWQDINVLEEELSDKADKEALEALKQEMEALSDKQAEYPTKEWVEGQGYLTEHQHLKTINGESLVGDGNIIIEGGTSVDLSNYYTKTESDGRYGTLEEQKSLRNDVEEALGEAAKNEVELQKKADRSDLADYQPKGDYVTEDSLEDKLSEYPTKEWVEGQGYLTEHQHLKTINGESLVGDGNIEIDAYTKEESDARYGSKEEQESLRNDVEEALGESAKNEADLQKKADKSELDSIREELSEIRNQFSYSEPTVKYMTKDEYESLDTKGKHTFYVLTDANELWLGDNKLFPISEGSDTPSEDEEMKNLKVKVVDINGNENKVECNESKILSKDEFRGLYEVKSAVIGDCVDEIDSWAFAFNEDMTSVKLPKTLKRINHNAFHFCDNLKIVLNEGLEYIGDYAFECCDSLYDLVIPSTVKEIGISAFYYVNTDTNPIDYDKINENRKVRVMCETPPVIGSNVFRFNTSSKPIPATYPIYVKDELVDTYKQAEGWSVYADRIHPMSEYK